LGTLQSPVSQLVGAIQAPIQQLVGLLEAYQAKLEGGQSEASPAA
jgi:ribosomal protein L10